MNTIFNYRLWRISMALAFSASFTYANAATGNGNITLIEMGDLHGTLVSHAAVLKNTDGSVVLHVVQPLSLKPTVTCMSDVWI